MDGRDWIWKLTGNRKKMAGGGGDDGRMLTVAALR
jgi:hypothetical protein